MKTSVTYTIDVENAAKLQQIDNASGLVNKLLTEYFSYSSGKKKSDTSEIGTSEATPTTNEEN